MSFLTLSLGKEIGFTDWEGNTWKAIILNPDSVFARNRLNDIQTPLELELAWSAFIGMGLQELALLDTASCQKISHPTGTNTFISWNFTDIKDSIKALSSNSTLNFSDSLRRVYDIVLTDTLSLVSSAIAVQQVEDTLTFSQVAWSNLPQVNANNTLVLSNVSSPGLHYLDAENQLQLWYQRQVVLN